jgi:uncharacterized membrane protein YidH (DUF202 family)
VTVLDEDFHDQHERTLLAWRRTALSLVAAGLLVAHLAARDVGTGALALTLAGTAAAVGFVWLSHDRSTGAAGFGLVVGVVLLGAVALLGVAYA